MDWQWQWGRKKEPKTSMCKTRHYYINKIVYIHITLLIRSGRPKPSSGEGKGRFLELFQHWGHLAFCILAPNKFPHSSPEAPRIIQMRETSTSEGGNYYQILLANSNLRKSARIFLHAAKLGHGTYYFTEDFPDTRKIQRLRPGLNPRTRVPVASILTTRPPKPSCWV